MSFGIKNLLSKVMQENQATGQVSTTISHEAVKEIIIVYNQEEVSKLAAEYFIQVSSEIFKNNTTILCTTKLWNEKEYVANKQNINDIQNLLFIGRSDIFDVIDDVRYNEYATTYGWSNNKAYIHISQFDNIIEENHKKLELDYEADTREKLEKTKGKSVLSSLYENKEKIATGVFNTTKKMLLDEDTSFVKKAGGVLLAVSPVGAALFVAGAVGYAVAQNLQETLDNLNDFDGMCLKLYSVAILNFFDSDYKEFLGI